jgi:hypothetical protein
VIFRYAEYERFLEHMKGIAEITPLSGWTDSKKIILRHDVDFDMDAAYRLSGLESRCGVRSSYFILTTCRTYNPLTAGNRARLRAMAAEGFEIGLHFDPTVYGTAEVGELKEHADREADLLASVIGRDVRSVSLHNPSLHGQYPLFEGYQNAYDPRIFSDDRYLSDSCMDFKGKDPFAFVRKAEEGPIQILLHPLHYTDTGTGYREIMGEHIRRYVSGIDESFRIANKTYEREVVEGLWESLAK